MSEMSIEELEGELAGYIRIANRQDERFKALKERYTELMAAIYDLAVQAWIDEEPTIRRETLRALFKEFEAKERIG